MSSVLNIFKGVLISFISTISFLLIFSIILTYTNVNENFITPTIIVITSVSIFIGSSIGNFKIKQKGILNGAIIGSIYLIVIYLMSSFLNNDFFLTTQSIIMIILGSLCGMFGGILGVNKN